MIIKRIRRGRRRARGPVLMMARVVTALSAYIVDANTERLKAFDKVIDLSRYLADLHGVEGGEGFAPGEKVAALGTRNLRGHDLAAWQDELVAAAARCPRSHAPTEHYVISLKKGERFDDGQPGEAVDIFLNVLGAENCPVLWAVHDNTDDVHIHVMLVRVDMRDGSTVTLGDGWDIDRLHQSLALIEERQRWAPEAGALYIAREGEVFDRQSGRLVRDAQGQQAPRSRRKTEEAPVLDVPTRTLIAAAVSKAMDWADFHRLLAEQAIYYRKAGSGARLEIVGESHKASALDGAWSRTALEERFGPFVPRRTDGGSSYEDYRIATTAELNRIRSVHAEAKSHLREAKAHALTSLPGPHAATVRIAITAEFANASKALDDAFGRAKTQFATDRMSLAQWQEAGGPAAPKTAILPAMILPADTRSSEQGVAVPTGFVAGSSGWHTEYRDRADQRAWTDYRVLVAVHRGNVPTVEAAMLLAAQRWGRLRVAGSDAFLKMTAQVAARHGIVLVDARGVPLPTVTATRLPEVRADRPIAKPAAKPPSPPAKASGADGQRQLPRERAPESSTGGGDDDISWQRSRSRGHSR